MKVTSITIDNFLGIEHLEVKPGALTVIEGGNDKGKTSITESIIGAIGGGNDATLLRKGSKSGSVVIVFDDQTKLTCAAKGEKLERTVEHPKLGPLKNVAPYLERLRDMLSVNPIPFLTAPKKYQLDAFLDICPITVSDKELLAAGAKTLPPDSKNGLERIAIARKVVYDERTGVNKAKREADATIAKLEKSLPSASIEATDWTAAAEEADRQKAALEEKVREVTRVAAEQASTDLRASDRQCADETAALEADLKEFERDIRERIRLAEVRRGERAKAIQEERDRVKTLASQAAAPEIENLTATSAEARERARQADREENTRQILDEQRGAVGRLARESEALTETLEKLDALKDRALANLPIPGVEIVDGEIEVGGIPVHRLNGAKKVQLILNLAALRAGELALCCVDGLESLDDDVFAAFEEMAPRTGLQFIVTRVTKGERTIRTTTQSAAA